MTTETTSSLEPGAVLDAARRFFTGSDRVADAWIDTESDMHVAFGTFRGNLSVAAFPDPDGSGRTRVRVSTLREEGLVPRFMTYVSSRG